MPNQTDILEDVLLDEEVLDMDLYQLIVWNDDVNTFEWVIQTLMEICNHTFEQAQQCSMIIHTKGKCSVKNGDWDTLEPLCKTILERGIQATVEINI